MDVVLEEERASCRKQVAVMSIEDEPKKLQTSSVAAFFCALFLQNEVNFF